MNDLVHAIIKEIKAKYGSDNGGCYVEEEWFSPANVIKTIKEVAKVEDVTIKSVIPVPTAGGCHMYYGKLTDGNWFFCSDSWDYGYVLNCNPTPYMWDDDFEEKINQGMVVAEICDDSDEFEFDDFFDMVIKWLVNNGHREFTNY